MSDLRWREKRRVNAPEMRKEVIMATTKKATQKATENVKVSYYGNRDAMMTAATLRGN